MVRFYTFLINPTAGNGHAKNIWPILERYLDEQNINYAVQYTKYKGHALQLVTQINTAHPNSIIVVLGGDGTLHEVLNGLQIHQLENTLAYIPCGSGNDFARGAKISADALSALKSILKQTQPTLIDIGFYEDQNQKTQSFFTNNLGIGFDATIVYYANHSYMKRLLNKHRLGFLAYAFSFFKAFLHQRPFCVKVKTKQQTYTFKHAFLCTITNHPYFGGGVCLMPTAKLNDGKLDLVIIEKNTTLRFILIFLLMILPKHLHTHSKNVHHFQSDYFEVYTTHKNHCHADGEDLPQDSYCLSFFVRKQKFLL